MNMQQCEIKLNVDEVNTVLRALGKLPYEQVFQLVTHIHQQVGPQVQPAASTENVEAAQAAA